jgi:hypothetical protein
MVKMIAYLWTQYVGCQVLVLHGETCHRTMVIGKVFIIAITTGQKKVISRQYKKDGDHEWHRLDGSIIKVHQDAMRRRPEHES